MGARRRLGGAEGGWESVEGGWERTRGWMGRGQGVGRRGGGEEGREWQRHTHGAIPSISLALISRQQLRILRLQILPSGRLDSYEGSVGRIVVAVHVVGEGSFAVAACHPDFLDVFGGKS